MSKKPKHQHVERTATVSEARARQQLLAAFPEYKIENFEHVGNKFFADLRLAEFPPAPKEDKMPEPKDDAPEEDPKGDDLLDLTDDSDDKDPLDDDGDDDDDDAKKEDKILDKLDKIMDHLGLKDDDEEMKPDEESGLDLPDVGAPPAGEPMGGPPGGALPPPAPAPSKPGLGGAFSHVLQRKVGSRRSFTAQRHAAGDVSNTQLIAEAVSGFPGYRVARINREENGSALIALVAK